MKKPEETIVDLTCPACGAHPEFNSEGCWRCGEEFEEELIERIERKSERVPFQLDLKQKYADLFRHYFMIALIPLFFIQNLIVSLTIFALSALVFFSQRRWYKFGGKAGIFSAVQVFFPFLIVQYFTTPFVSRYDLLFVSMVTFISAVIVLLARSDHRYLSFALLGAATGLLPMSAQYRLIWIGVLGIVFGLLVREFIQIDTYFVPAYLLPVPLIQIFFDSRVLLIALLASGATILLLTVLRETEIRKISPWLLYKLGGLHEEVLVDKLRPELKEDMEEESVKIADAWLRKAKYQLSEGEKEKAEKSIKEAYEKNPDVVEVQVMRYFLEKDEEAISEARRKTLKRLKKYMPENLSYREKVSLLNLVPKAFSEETLDYYFERSF
ncbi:MAG: hypothetical protein KGY76_02750 [Candidatus Thermoplasmatota archaeon]|nr:hypothetical protein [Candidatus Thermoplasmatota archaeon]